MVLVLFFIATVLSAQDAPTASPGVNLPLELRSRLDPQPQLLPPQTPVPETVQEERREAESSSPLTNAPVRSFTLRTGETLNVFFEGEGWIYENSGPELGTPVRERTSGGTRFRFQPKSAGTFRVVFQRQDPVQGRILYQTVRLDVRDNTPPEMGSGNTQNPPPALSHLEALRQQARRLYSLGQFSQLYRLLGNSPSSGDSSLVELKALAAEGLGRSQEALELWRRAVDASNAEEKQDTLVKSLMAAVRLRDGLRLVEFWTLYETSLSQTRPPTLSEDDFWSLVAALSEKAPALAPSILGLWEDWYPDGRGRDKWHYFMARWLEQEKKDYREALRHYNQVMDHPLSPYHRIASERSANLRQRLYLIR